MLRSSILAVTVLSFLSNTSFAAIENSDEALAKKFAAAQLLSAQGQVTQAITAYQALINANPLLPEAYNNLAALYLKQNKTNQAKNILEQGLLAHKGYGVLYENLTAINVAMARDAYSQALQIDVKPSDIRIASLSLDENKQYSEKNTSNLSKVTNAAANITPTAPVIENKTNVEDKTVVEVEAVTEAETVPEVKAEEKITVAENPAGNIPRARVIIEPKLMDVKKENNIESIETVLKAWSVAWSAQAVDLYLSFYHEEHKPSNGMSRNAWAQSRRYRLKKPSWIKVALSDFEIEKNTGKQATVKFKQLYQSNSFQDVSTKQMVLLYTDNGWQIFREQNL